MRGQIVLICIGALISNLTFILNKIIEGLIKTKGKVIIYRKLVYQKNSDKKSIGIYENDNEIIMNVPLWLEIQNTKKIPIIIRDFSVVLYKKGKRIKRMKQINRQTDNIHGELVTVYYGDNGRYSFIIPPESIRSFELLYVLKKNECNDDFDEIKIAYYNQKNKLTVRELKSIESSWSLQQFGVDEDWVKVN